MSASARSALVTAVAIVACFAGWWSMFLRNETLRELLAAEQLRARLLADVDRLESRLAQAVENLPADARDANWFRPRVTDALRGTGLAVAEWREVAVGERLGEWELNRVTFLVTGRFPDITSFLGWLERATPRVRLERLLLEHGSGSDVKASVRVLVPAPPRGV